MEPFERILLYVEQVLVPTLVPGDIVILDNLGSHKGQRARRAIPQAGAQLVFLPTCSPDLNPIEQLFAKLKHLMPAAEQRTAETTWRKADAILDLVSPTECTNSLVNSGHASA
jgi:transposase